ncbi:MAG TPA: preprotein translocase subunit SecY, partial [bacterium (Candidatus Stahlbacteria)]|nr:preprotein translocase subunit SecY [Candidatus Stahlbacteria bacterium]
AAIQAIGIAVFLEAQKVPLGDQVVPIVVQGGMGFRFLTMITLTCGTIFAMWLGEQITEKGVGNGISFIIFIGCLEEYPQYFLRTFEMVRAQGLSVINLILIVVVMVLVVAGVVIMTQAMRRIPVQYPKRVVGRRLYGGQSTHLPLRVNTAGVIPIIFAQSLMVFPGTVASFVPQLAIFRDAFKPGIWYYDIMFFVLIVYFCYFYTSIVFNPRDLAENMKRYGGFIPGIRPGPKTAEYIDSVLTKITLPGAVFLASIALLPYQLYATLKIPFYFGGTTLLIIVGVALDTVQQIEAQLLMHHYEGFLKRGKVRGRRW